MRDVTKLTSGLEDAVKACEDASDALNEAQQSLTDTYGPGALDRQDQIREAEEDVSRWAEGSRRRLIEAGYHALPTERLEGIAEGFCMRCDYAGPCYCGIARRVMDMRAGDLPGERPRRAT
jgi:hypothetical protein